MQELSSAYAREGGVHVGLPGPTGAHTPQGGKKGGDPTVDHFYGYLHQNNPAASTGVGKKMRRTFRRYPTGPQYNTTGGIRRTPCVYNTSAPS